MERSGTGPGHPLTLHSRNTGPGAGQRLVIETAVVAVDGAHDEAAGLAKLPGLSFGQRVEDQAADLRDMAARGFGFRCRVSYLAEDLDDSGVDLIFSVLVGAFSVLVKITTCRGCVVGWWDVIPPLGPYCLIVSGSL